MSITISNRGTIRCAPEQHELPSRKEVPGRRAALAREEHQRAGLGDRVIRERHRRIRTRRPLALHRQPRRALPGQLVDRGISWDMHGPRRVLADQDRPDRLRRVIDVRDLMHLGRRRSRPRGKLRNGVAGPGGQGIARGAGSVRRPAAPRRGWLRAPSWPRPPPLRLEAFSRGLGQIAGREPATQHRKRAQPSALVRPPAARRAPPTLAARR